MKKIGDEDRVQMYQAYYDQMLKFGYSPEYIGEELAFIVRATRMGEEGN